MGEILGLTVTDFPNIRMHPHWMTGVLQGNIARGWEERPHLRDPKNWPKEMQELWYEPWNRTVGEAPGEAAARAAQAHQIEQCRKLRTALDDFNPDFMVMLYREHTDVFGDVVRFQYNIQAHEALRVKPFQVFGRRDNYFEEDPDRVVLLQGHQEGALHLVRELQDRGRNPFYTLEPFITDTPQGRDGFATGRHNLLAAAVHLDWDTRDFKRPIVPIGVDPLAFCRERNNEGLSTWDRTKPRPLLPTEAFGLGREIAQIYRASPWKVALVAAVDWSHANNSDWEYERLHPDIEADRKRFEEWKSNRFTTWGDEGNWTFEEMEEHAQWELLVTIILAGAMTEIGAKVVHADFAPTWIFNDNFVTTIFEPK